MRISLRREQILRLLDGHPVQLATEVGLLEFHALPDGSWNPMVRIEMGDAITKLHQAAGIEGPDECWWNGVYDCFAKHHDDGITHLSIKRLDRAPLHNWRHLQQIKNEVCGEEREAVEIYPRESRLADNANQYHLWVLPPGMDVPTGFDSGMVVIDPADVENFNTNGGKGRQEPLQEGLTLGRAMLQAEREQFSANERRTKRSILDGTIGRVT